MRIGVISDTHIEEPEEDLPARVYEIFSGVDLILHAGDIYVPQVLDRLERIAPVTAVEGNGEWDRRVKDQRLAEGRVRAASSPWRDCESACAMGSSTLVPPDHVERSTGRRCPGTLGHAPSRSP